MSTYGEIVEPVSRAAWEDWDYTTEDYVLSLHWSSNAVTPKNINKLFILEGKFLYDCVTFQPDSKMELINSIKKVGLNLYKMDQSNKYICVIKGYNLLHSSEIVELLVPYIMASSDIIAIQTKPLAEYQSFEVTNQACIIRKICTTKSHSYHYPKLEQPNIMSGISAGVISLREHLNLVGTALVCYVDNPDEYPVEEIETLLRDLHINNQANIKPNGLFNSNLYI